MIELREWSRIADELKEERTRLSNRLRDQLWRYYSQAGALTDDLAAAWFLDLWEKVPGPAQAAREVAPLKAMKNDDALFAGHCRN